MLLWNQYTEGEIMGQRLKKIKKSELGEFGKKVVDSLIAQHPTKPQKEESHEQMRCKVEIFEGYQNTNIKRSLIDSFVVNTNSLEKLKSDIHEKYGVNAQYTITNLTNNEVVLKVSVYTGGYNKEKTDKEHFSKQMELIRRIFKMKEEGKSEIETCDKLSSYAARSAISKVYNSTEEQMIQKLRNDYNNQSLGQSSTSEILSEDLNPKKDIINDINTNGEKDEYEE